MKYLFAAAALALFTIASPVLADTSTETETEDVVAGDPVAGEADFKKCKACHMITAPDGTAVQKGGKVGPDLWGVIGRQIGSMEGFSYGASLIAAGADGTAWDEEMLAAYLVDPTVWLKEKTADESAKSKMTFKLKEGGEDVAAYLASLNPEE